MAVGTVALSFFVFVPGCGRRFSYGGVSSLGILAITSATYLVGLFFFCPLFLLIFIETYWALVRAIPRIARNFVLAVSLLFPGCLANKVMVTTNWFSMRWKAKRPLKVMFFAAALDS